MLPFLKRNISQYNRHNNPCPHPLRLPERWLRWLRADYYLLLWLKLHLRFFLGFCARPPVLVGYIFPVLGHFHRLSTAFHFSSWHYLTPNNLSNNSMPWLGGDGLRISSVVSPVTSPPIIPPILPAINGLPTAY